MDCSFQYVTRCFLILIYLGIRLAFRYYSNGIVIINLTHTEKYAVQSYQIENLTHAAQKNYLKICIIYHAAKIHV